MTSINFTNRAVDDLDAIGDYHAHYSSVYASQLQDGIINRAEALRQFPELGRVVPEFNNPSIRELLHKPYRIVYRLVSQARIDILTIQHSSRHLAERFFDT